MPDIFQIPGAGLFQQMDPLDPAAVGWMDNATLGFPTGAGAIPFAVRIDSGPILVVGFNSFMAIGNVDLDNVTVWVSHCDPTTGVILVTVTAGSFVAGTDTQLTFGAFHEALAADTTRDDWLVIRIGLQGEAIDATLNRIDLFGGTR
jgi:hypothetical protein